MHLFVDTDGVFGVKEMSKGKIWKGIRDAFNNLKKKFNRRKYNSILILF